MDNLHNNISNDDNYINNIKIITKEVKDKIYNIQPSEIDNIKNIIALGDLHADLEILLDFLKHLNIISVNKVNNNDIDKSKNYYYYKYNNNDETELYFYNYLNNTNTLINNFNKELYNNNNTNNLIINERSYFNFDEKKINNDEFENYYHYYIIFDINKIKEYNNTLFVILGDITDSHYEIRDYNYKSMYINDIGCYQLLLFLKRLIKFNNENITNSLTDLRILFGNHEFYELFRTPKDFINEINKFIINNKINKEISDLITLINNNKFYETFKTPEDFINKINKFIINDNNKILFDNNKLNELYKSPKEDIINEINKIIINNNKRTELEEILFPDLQYTINGFIYTLDHNEFEEYDNIVKVNNVNQIDEEIINKLRNSNVKKILDKKFNRRRNIILNNLNNIDFIIMVNKKILLSHTFIFKDNIIALKKILSSKLDKKDNYYINDSHISEVELLNILSKYVLNKLNDNTFKLSNNDENTNFTKDIISHLFRLINGRNPIKYKNKNTKQTEIYPSSILCNSSNYDNINEHFHNLSCKDKVHIVGHMPQLNIIRKNYTSINDIDKVFKYNDNQTLHKPYYIYNVLRDEQNNQQLITSIPYDDFYLYYNDNHLSLSFNVDKDARKDNDHYYYLVINCENKKIKRQLVQFKEQDNYD